MTTDKINKELKKHENISPFFWVGIAGMWLSIFSQRFEFLLAGALMAFPTMVYKTWLVIKVDKMLKELE